MLHEPTSNDLLREIMALRERVEELIGREMPQEYYSTEEFARLTNLRPKTVRDYCVQGRLNGTKKRSGHGRVKEWAISHEELRRYRRDGLLPRQKAVDRNLALAGV